MKLFKKNIFNELKNITMKKSLNRLNTSEATGELIYGNKN